ETSLATSVATGVSSTSLTAGSPRRFRVGLSLHLRLALSRTVALDTRGLLSAALGHTLDAWRTVLHCRRPRRCMKCDGGAIAALGEWRALGRAPYPPTLRRGRQPAIPEW